MGETKPGPEFADTSGDKVSVFVEVGRGGERIDLATAAESFEIEALSSINLGKHAPNFDTIARGQFFEPVQQRRQLLDQAALRQVALFWRERFFQLRGGLVPARSLDGSRELLKALQSASDGQLRRVSNRIGRARKQVGERQRIAEGRRKNSQRQIERTRHGTKNRSPKILAFGKSAHGPTLRTSMTSALPMRSCPATCTCWASGVIGAKRALARHSSIWRTAIASIATGSLLARM